MASWRDLELELGAWRDAGLTATLWWRDDDASDATPALERLCALSLAAARKPIPLALAVVPQPATAALARHVAGHAHLHVLQHGFSHRNYAGIGEKKCELCATRPIGEMAAELIEGRRRLADMLGLQSLPILVPPWNRLAPGLLAVMFDTGLRGLSTYGPRRSRELASGLRQANAHIDVIDWQGGRGFLGEGRALALAVSHLDNRRRELADRAEPTGLLTHHLVHDEATWSFVRNFLEFTAAHGAVRWLAGPDVFEHSMNRPLLKPV